MDSSSSSSRLHLLPLLLLLGLVFLFSGLLVNAVQATLYLLVRPINPWAYRKINYYLAYSLNSQLVFLVEWWSGSDTLFYGHPSDKKNHLGNEHALLLMNHTYDVDWLMGWVVVERFGVLGNAKVFIKKMLQKVPVMGWNWFFSESVYLERDWTRDQVTFGPQLLRLVDYPDPIWLLLFAEGTRFTPEKHRLSMEVARSKGIPELKHHLLPRTRGFVASLPFIRGRIPAIYDVIVAVPPVESEKAQLHWILLEKSPLRAHLLIRRIPLEEVPSDPEKAADWLQELYRKKDAVLESFLSSCKKGGPEAATFPLDAAHGLEGYQRYKLPRRPWTLVNECWWAGVTMLTLLWGLVSVFTSGNTTLMVGVSTLLLLALVGLKKMIGLTKISTASSYGSSPTQGSPTQGSPTQGSPTQGSPSHSPTAERHSPTITSTNGDKDK